MKDGLSELLWARLGLLGVPRGQEYDAAVCLSEVLHTRDYIEIKAPANCALLLIVARRSRCYLTSGEHSIASELQEAAG